MTPPRPSSSARRTRVTASRTSSGVPKGKACCRSISPQKVICPLCLRAQLLDVHAEELRVDGVDADLDEVGEDGRDVAVGVEKGELAGVVDDLHVFSVAAV